MTDIKVGSEWVGKLGGNLDIEVKVRYVTEVDGKTFITYEKSGRVFGKPETVLSSTSQPSFLLTYKEKEDFFVLGGEYKSNRLKYYVKEIYVISIPLNSNFRKLGVRDRMELVLYARRVGIGPRDRSE